VAAGSLLGIVGALACWRVIRALHRGDMFPELDRNERRITSIGLGLFILGGAVATHGPIATLAREPRITTDLSHFALPAIILLAASGALIALAIWRERLRRLAHLTDAANNSMRREFARSVALLAVWLTIGLGLAVWNGRIARSAFEEGLLRRATMAASLLNADMTAATFGPELQLARIETPQPADGRKIHIAVMTGARTPALDKWRERLRSLLATNPDVPAIYVEVIRDGWLFVPVTSLDRKRLDRSYTTPISALGPFAGVEPFVDGPTRSYFGGDAFFARAPLFSPDAPKTPVAWLVFGVSATQWTAAFTQARVQAMALAGLGFVLWVVTLAYRLRREEQSAAMRRAATAVESERLKTAFLAKVSHELRTPIQTILGYGELLSDARLEEQPRRWLSALRSHGEIMHRLVNDLLDVSALDAGAFQLRPKTTDFHELVADCVAALRVRAEAKGLTLESCIGGDVPTWVEIDPVRMRQILLNLLGNAVKFTPKGHVNLSVERVDETDGQIAQVEIVVSDTGPGIPAAQRHRLFQPFVQLGETPEGTGLGLSLVAGLCTAMGGSVRCDEVAVGARFSVRLPLARRPMPVSADLITRETFSYRGRRIVVADDNALVRDFVVEALSARGADVTAVGDGQAAIVACAERTPFAVILDLSMPLLDGFEAALAIRQQPQGKAIRIVGLSAHAQTEDERRALESGMDVFLSKPVSLAQLDIALCQNAAALVEPAPGNDEVWAQVREKLRTQFQLETPLLVDELRAAIRAGDWNTARARAHYLKGSADIIGARDLQAACQNILKPELLATAGQAAELLGKIEAAAHRALAESSIGVPAQ
jgi:signal transduction histidine kinase/DNA-binding NarL/FixJ family response regulator